MAFSASLPSRLQLFQDESAEEGQVKILVAQCPDIVAGLSAPGGGLPGFAAGRRSYQLRNFCNSDKCRHYATSASKVRLGMEKSDGRDEAAQGKVWC